MLITLRSVRECVPSMSLITLLRNIKLTRYVPSRKIDKLVKFLSEKKLKALEFE